MASKLLHSLADENPDLQKQIGCMTGIIQLFDRHHVLSGRRISQKRLPPGNSHFADGSLERDSNNVLYRQTAPDMNKSVNEKRRVSTESSRASFPSCSSSFSSLDCNQAAQPEASFDRTIFPETPSRDQRVTSPHLGMQSLDMRDVVKDSMYREARVPCVKTTTIEEAVCYPMKHTDSPRPLQMSKLADGSYSVGINGKTGVPIDLKESLSVLAKLREAPQYYNESRELARSLEVKEGPWLSVSKDAPRFSYDGREINRLSFELRDTLKSMPKLKELPRLSLDSREVSMRSSSSDSKPIHFSNGFQSNGNSNDKISYLPQSSATKKRPPSVVAKLMGLEAFPDSSIACDTQSGLTKSFLVEAKYSFPRNDINSPIQAPKSPRNSLKDPISPRRRNPDLAMRPISSSRVPIELAPWKKLDQNRGYQKSGFRPIKGPSKSPDSFPSVYSEIEKRLKDLEFKQSGRDLRALKQILDAMQAKGLLESRKEEQTSGLSPQGNYGTKCMNVNQNSVPARRRILHGTRANYVTYKGMDSARGFESPIVIMKPAKLSTSHSLQSGQLVDTKKHLGNGRPPKDHSPRSSNRDAAACSADKNANNRNGRSVQSLSRPQQLPKENTPSSTKNSGSVSPRLPQKKIELEKRSRPPTSPSDSNKPRRQPNRQATGSCSPGGKTRPKSYNMQLSDDCLCEISNESRASSCQGDDMSLQSDSNNAFESKIEMEVTSALHSTEINDSQSPSMKSMKYLVSSLTEGKSSKQLYEDGSAAELATVALEQPSPVSVLDASIYKDDVPSPVKQILNSLKDDVAREPSDCLNEDQWNPKGSFLSKSIGSACLTSEFNLKKLQSLEHLVQKLRRLNSSHDEAGNDYIAMLCENTNPDHRYISEILLASGLLLRDLSSDLLTFQLHPSGHPINPELFFVLEQTNASSLLPEQEHGLGEIAHSKRDKFHRKLIFDAVNEILGEKVSLLTISLEPWLKPSRLAKKTLCAQKLLKQLCSEIEQIQANKLGCGGFEDDEEDGLKGILWEDVMQRSGSWTDFVGEMPGVVLDVERLVFKDLVDEIVIGEAGGSRAKPGRRRQLFAK